jgi:hypothetical protein
MRNHFGITQRPKEMKERINQASRDANELIENAKQCLADPKFTQFKENYKTVFSNLIQLMLELPRNDDREFSAQMDSIRMKVILLQGFGYRIEEVANMSKKPIIPTHSGELKANE